MCFYYSITKKSINTLVKGSIIKETQLSLFEEKYIVNGFEHPKMPIVIDSNPTHISQVQWGFMPSQIKSIEHGFEFLGKYNTLNAKSEDITQSHLFSEAFAKQRCLVLCSGFFEWRKVKKEKVPYYISLNNDEMFVFAGIWNESTDVRGNKYLAFAILTTTANEIMSIIHNTKLRMPLILTPENAITWLSKEATPQQLLEVLKPNKSLKLKAHSIKKFMPNQTAKFNSNDIIAYYNYPEIFGLLSNQETILKG